MKENNGSIFSKAYAMFGIVTLVLAVVGTSIAYFSATTDVNDNTIAGQTASAANITLNVLQVSPTDLTGTSGKIIPLESGEANTGDGALQFENQMDAALKNNCVYNGYVACQVYRITVTNSGSDPVTATPKVKLTYSNGFENLRWQKLTGTNSSDFAVTGTSVKNHNEYTELSPITNLTNRTTSGNVQYVVVWLEETGLVQNETGLTFNGTVAVDVLDINNNRLVDNLTVDFTKKGNAVNYITNLYLNNKSKVVTNNSIQYQYSESVGLMNDRLGGTTSNKDDGNIRYYGAEPNNYVYIDTIEEEERQFVIYGWQEEGYESYDACMGVFDSTSDSDSEFIPNNYPEEFELCSNPMYFAWGYDTLEDCVSDRGEEGSLCSESYISLHGYSSVASCVYEKIGGYADEDGDIDPEEICGRETINDYTKARELYRIIGVFKDVELANGTKQDLIKVVKDESIGPYQWDTKSEGVGSFESSDDCYPYYGEDEGGMCGGSNDWTDAELMMLLNPGYNNEKSGGSLWWNSNVNSCYGGYDMFCDFTQSGLFEDTHDKIENVVWNLGGLSSVNMYSNQLYIEERGTNVYKNTSIGLERPTFWTGRVALMYPSDYSYSTDFSLCNNTISNFSHGEYGEGTEEQIACYNNSWLSYISDLFLSPTSQYSNGIYVANYTGNVGISIANSIFDSYEAYEVAARPTFYLSPELEILSGDGSSEEPFVLG